MTLEREVEAYLIKRVKELGGEVRKVKWIGRRGAPDRLVLLPVRDDNFKGEDTDDPFTLTIGPHEYWVELKRPGEKATAAQLREHERMRIFGMRVHVLDTKEKIDCLLGR